MDQAAQQAMDGSPALVVRTGRDLWSTGKFRELGLSVEAIHEEYIRIKFQCGPLGEVGVNGCSIEDVIDVLAERLEGFQAGPFKCQENADALSFLYTAKGVLLTRTARRQAQGVEGRNLPHV